VIFYYARLTVDSSGMYPHELLEEASSDRRTSQNWRNNGWALCLMAIVYLGIMASTHALNVGDAPLYAGDISTFAANAGSGEMTEFDHVWWRPLGYGVARLAWPAFGDAPEPARRLFTRSILDRISLVCGAITALLFWLLSWEVSGSRLIAGLVTTGFICFEAFVNFSHSGTSYIPGLMLSTLGLWMAGKSAVNQTRWGFLSGLAMGAAALMWIPYVFSIPACLLKGVLWLPARERKAFLLSSVLGAAIIGLGGYGVSATARGATNVHEVRAWVQDGVHTSRQKNFLREGIGLPRAFMSMGTDGILFKRYVFHDPYSPVRIIDLLTKSLWKILLFYLFSIALLRTLFGHPGILLLLVVASLPHLWLGLRFEAGSAERYLPLFPFLVIAVAQALVSGRRLGWATGIIVAFLVFSTGLNLFTFTWSAERFRIREAAIARGLKEFSRPGSLLWICDTDLSAYLAAYPQDVGTYLLPPLRWLSPPASVTLSWKQDFAKESLVAWARGGNVWVTQRYLASRPQPDWHWVEHDRADSTWSDFPAFFSQFDLEGPAGGANGFVKLENSGKNRSQLEALAPK
jgi:hypothetical protein